MRSFRSNVNRSSAFHSRTREGEVVRPGFTLIEVVVGLVLMASILGSSLLAFAAHQKQLSRADKTIAAVAVADDLLHQFSVSQEGIPEVGRGPVAGQPRWVWETSTLGAAAPMKIPMRVVRLAIVETKDDGERITLASVDIVERSR